MTASSNRHSINLTGKWLFAFSSDGSFPIRREADITAAGLSLAPCVVPGNFELDLQRNGVIDEPFYGMNIASLRQYESTHVWYARKFSAVRKVGLKSRLRFDGIDCFSEIFLNGRLLGKTDNMLVEHIFDVDDFLEGENELVVHISPAVNEAKKYDYPQSVEAIKHCYDSLYVRKAPHMYGWDIMPRALSAGIWRPVTLTYVPDEHIKSIYVSTLSISPDKSSATIRLRYELDIGTSADDIYGLTVEGSCGDSRFEHSDRVLFGHGSVIVDIPSPKLWWPKGRGDASLYNIVFTLLKNGAPTDSQSVRTGIRISELERTSLTDSAGAGKFCFHINGERIFVLGTNWVPLDAYHSRDLSRLPAALALVEDIGCNMIRCWGGNVYENDLFYDLCDEKGILVWQDFAMACAIYPQDDEFKRRIEEEARKVVRRLRNHPCIALWAGDNECDDAYDWNRTKRDPNTNRLTRQTLPNVVLTEAGSAPFLPSSPYCDATAYRDRMPGQLETPEAHLWGPRNYYKSDDYTKFLAHFASEMGYHGCPSPESMAQFISPKALWPYQNNEEWLLHCTSPIPGVNLFDYRVELMATQIRLLFGEVPDNLSDYCFASQATQAEAFKFFIETFRTQKWRRTGIIWWNIIDGWPQLSDAVVDYYFSKKLAYYSIKRSQSPILIALAEPVDGRQAVIAVNDTRSDVQIEYSVTSADGVTAVSGQSVASADKSSTVAWIPYDDSRQVFYNLRWSTPTGEGKSHYLAGKPPFNLLQYRKWIADEGLVPES